MDFQEEASLELTAHSVINGSFVADSHKRFFIFYHLILWEAHAIVLYLSFISNAT